MNASDAVSNAQTNADNKLRVELEKLLKGELTPEVEPRAYTSEQVNEVVGRLQLLEQGDHTNKLIVAGFTSTPYYPEGNRDDEQACETCMYYLMHRRFCELPELMLPVEENWSCRLWRI